MSQVAKRRTHDIIRDYLRDNGTTRASARQIGVACGVSYRSVNYALKALLEEGLIEERWEGLYDRVTIWVGEDAGDEAQAAPDSHVPATA